MASLSLTLQPVRRRVFPSLGGLSRIFLPTRSWRFGIPSRPRAPPVSPLPKLPTFLEPRPISALLATLLDLWLPPIVLAVPKKKVSHSRKSMRSANKGLKDKTNIVACPACGQPKLSHHLCHACYGHMARSKKEELGYVEPQREEPQIEKAEEPRRDTPIPDLPEPQEHPQSASTWERREKGLLSGALSPLTKWWRK